MAEPVVRAAANRDRAIDDPRCTLRHRRVGDLDRRMHPAPAKTAAASGAKEASRILGLLLQCPGVERITRDAFEPEPPPRAVERQGARPKHDTLRRRLVDEAADSHRFVTKIPESAHRPHGWVGERGIASGVV